MQIVKKNKCDVLKITHHTFTWITCLKRTFDFCLCQIGTPPSFSMCVLPITYLLHTCCIVLPSPKKCRSGWGCVSWGARPVRAGRFNSTDFRARWTFYFIHMNGCSAITYMICLYVMGSTFRAQKKIAEYL